MSSEPGAVREPGTVREAGIDDDEHGFGWVMFAGVMILVAGVMNTIYGIAAIANSSFYAGHHRFVFSDLKTWGWIVTIIGVLQGAAALGIWARQQWARWTGVFFAGLNLIAQLLYLPAYSPGVSLAIFTLDVLVIYGLIAYGGRLERA